MAADRTDFATRGFAMAINQAFALYTAVAAAASVALCVSDIPSVGRVWLMLFGVVALLGTAALILLSSSESWSRSMQRFFIAAVFATVITWPLAWQGTQIDVPPPIWPQLGVAVLMISWVAKRRWTAVTISVAASTVWACIRVGPSGGAVPVFEATQEGVLFVVLAIAASIMLAAGLRASQELDASTDHAAAAVEQIVVKSSMQREQHTLDALVHDQVMTTLAAAGRETMSASTVSDMATRAMTALTEFDVVEGEESTTVDEAVELLIEMVENVTTNAIFDVTPAPGIGIPQRVAMTLARAAQEAVLNAMKHADASEIRVTTRSRTMSNGEVDMRVEVSDNGIGFDVTAVSERRLGVRLALQERMRVIGGAAIVRSVPGRGTEIEFTWSGHPQVPTPIEIPEEINPGTFFEQLDLRLLVRVGRIHVLLLVLIGLVDRTFSGEPSDWICFGLLVAASAIILGRITRRHISWPCAVAVCVALSGVVATEVLHPSNWWPIDILLTVVIVVGLRVRGGPLSSWSAVALMAVSGWVVTQITDRPLAMTAISFLAPLVAALLSDCLMRWLASIDALVDEAHMSFEDRAAREATAYSALLRRDVWMVNLRAHVEPAMQRLADSSVPLTEAERAQCVRLEARLRDTITARNLVSPSVSEAVEHARERGVSVTLVDNRESSLPDQTRKAAQELLAAAARRTQNGRIVARVAPEGYTDLVTIMTDSEDSARLLSIDEEGQVTEK